MRKLSIFTTLLLFFCMSSCAQEIPEKELQIKTARLAAPEDMRAGATVLGFDATGNVVLLEEGSNSWICIADNPNKEGFHAVCYHENLAAFMERGRQLKKEGKSRLEIFDIREAEAKSGTLKMPEQPSTLHILSGKEGKFNIETGTVVDASYRYVVYIPFATAESTGLPTKPVVAGAPWIMDPGTHKAHIMITPPVN